MHSMPVALIWAGNNNKKKQTKKNKGEIGKATWAIKNGHVRANLLEKTISA